MSRSCSELALSAKADVEFWRPEFNKKGYFHSLEYLTNTYFISQILETYAN